MGKKKKSTAWDHLQAKIPVLSSAWSEEKIAGRQTLHIYNNYI